MCTPKVGIVENYTVDDWKEDMKQAQAIGIDGFALNCAPERIDNYTPRQLANAYKAAEELDFTVFVSFDFAYWTTGDTEAIIDIVQNYSTSPAQAKYRSVAPPANSSGYRITFTNDTPVCQNSSSPR